MKKLTAESFIQKQIVQTLIKMGFLVIRLNGGAVKTDNRFIRYYIIENTKKSSGVPDLLVFKNNQCIMFEVKNEIGKLSDNQKSFKELCKNHKFDYIYTVNDYIQVIQIIKELKI